MQFMTLTGAAALTSGTRKDLSLIDKALASTEKRALAEAALHIVARMLDRADENAVEETPLSHPEREAVECLGVDVAETMSDADFYKSGWTCHGLVPTSCSNRRLAD